MSLYAPILGELLIEERCVSSLCAAFTADSRKVQPGIGFAAIPGTVTDGHNFIPAALEKGASLIVAEREIPLPPGTPLLLVKDAAKAFALLCRESFGRPDEALHLLGVTGTNGKTTTAFLLEHIFNLAGFPCGLVSTVEYRTGDTVIPGDRTTPDTATLYSLFAKMKQNKLQMCAMELSSHALVQHRAAGSSFEVGIFTNLTGDHLDYHGTMENYYQAKKQLFENYLAPRGTAVINCDDPWGERLYKELENKVKLLGFSSSGKGNCRLYECQLESSGVKFRLGTPEWGEIAVRSNLSGEYNIRNLAGAILAALAAGAEVSAVQQALARPVHVPGRLESFPLPGGGVAFVDYAHTDDALVNVLSAVRKITKGKLGVLFGAGGDRDRSKRPRMGKAAAENADRLYITTDNPRSEEPQAIIDEILAGVPAGTDLQVCLSRAEAIAKALEECGRGDALVIAGKGHENYQEIKGVKHPFSDIAEIQDFMRRK